MRAYGLTELQQLVTLAFEQGNRDPRKQPDPPLVTDLLEELGIGHIKDEERTMPRKYR